jgi:hypothetical protein
MTELSDEEAIDLVKMVGQFKRLFYESLAKLVSIFSKMTGLRPGSMYRTYISICLDGQLRSQLTLIRF